MVTQADIITRSLSQRPLRRRPGGWWGGCPGSSQHYDADAEAGDSKQERDGAGGEVQEGRSHTEKAGL